jgi:hypothetical protein
MKSRNNFESGQAIVLLVLSIVVLLGFTALALDGGMVYSDRRHAQNAADTAALAGGGAAASILEEENIRWENWNCSNILSNPAKITNAAITRAATNSYDIDPYPGPEEHNFVRVQCNDVDKFLTVTTEIMRDTPTSMAHVLYNGPLRNVVEAVSKISPNRPLFAGNSIIALKPTPCSSSNGWGIELKGTSDVILSGGGAFSYSCVYGNGNIAMYVTGGSISAVRTQEGPPNNVIFDPDVIEGAAPLPIDKIDEPDCSSYYTSPRRPQPTATTIDPGWYESIRYVSNNADVTLNPGLYCIDNDFYFSGRNITGNGVTIYSEQGDFTVMANANAILSAPTENSPGVPPAIPGVLVYMTNGDVTMLGGATALYTGTIYAPGGDPPGSSSGGNVEIGGSSSANSEYNVQVIGWTVALHGTPGLGFVFNSEDNYRIPAKMDLYR